MTEIVDKKKNGVPPPALVLFGINTPYLILTALRLANLLKYKIIWYSGGSTVNFRMKYPGIAKNILAEYIDDVIGSFLSEIGKIDVSGPDIYDKITEYSLNLRKSESKTLGGIPERTIVVTDLGAPINPMIFLSNKNEALNILIESTAKEINGFITCLSGLWTKQIPGIPNLYEKISPIYLSTSAIFISTLMFGWIPENRKIRFIRDIAGLMKPFYGLIADRRISVYKKSPEQTGDLIYNMISDDNGNDKIDAISGRSLADMLSDFTARIKADRSGENLTTEKNEVKTARTRSDSEDIISDNAVYKSAVIKFALGCKEIDPRKAAQIFFKEHKKITINNVETLSCIIPAFILMSLRNFYRKTGQPVRPLPEFFERYGLRAQTFERYSLDEDTGGIFIPGDEKIAVSVMRTDFLPLGVKYYFGADPYILGFGIALSVLYNIYPGRDELASHLTEVLGELTAHINIKKRGTTSENLTYGRTTGNLPAPEIMNVLEFAVNYFSANFSVDFGI